MIEMRWVLTSEQRAGCFSEPLEWPDGSQVFARPQFRDTGLAGGPWQEIPVVNDLTKPPALAVIQGRRH